MDLVTENRTVCERPRCVYYFDAPSKGPANRKRFCSARCQQLEWQRRASFQFRKNNPKGYQACVERHAARIRRAIREAKAVPCTDCRVQYPSYVMDFDHVRGEKKFCIGGRAVAMGLTAVLAEIAKCEVVCSNCHRERTHQRKLHDRGLFLIIFECATCRWISEAEELPPSCTRCLARPVQLLSDEQVQVLIKAGTIIFCKSCDALHTR